MSCSMIAKVNPWLRRLRIVSPSACVITGLTRAVGSSSRMIFGSSISAREISSSFFWPPERFFADSLASGHRLTCSRRARAFATAARSWSRTREGIRKQRQRSSPYWCGLASSMFSRTVSSPSSREIWKVRTTPMRARSSGRSRRMLLPLERPAVLVHHRGKGLGDARGEIFRASADPEAPRVVRSVDGRMRMMDDVAALFRGDAELSGRRAAQLHARQARPHHVMGVPAVDHRVAEPVGHERRLLVALHAPDSLHGRHAVQRFLDQLYRDLALLDVADVAVVQRVEMRSEERRVGKECRSRWSP